MTIVTHRRPSADDQGFSLSFSVNSLGKLRDSIDSLFSSNAENSTGKNYESKIICEEIRQNVLICWKWEHLEDSVLFYKRRPRKLFGRLMQNLNGILLLIHSSSTIIMNIKLYLIMIKRLFSPYIKIKGNQNKSIVLYCSIKCR